MMLLCNRCRRPLDEHRTWGGSTRCLDGAKAHHGFTVSVSPERARSLDDAEFGPIVTGAPASAMMSSRGR